MTDIRFLGQSCFEITDGSTRVLIDPFLKPNNPISPVTGAELDAPTQILVTHGHVDHLADAAEIAKRTSAPIAALTELARWFAAQGVEDTSDPNLGGTVTFDGGWAKMVQAFHTSTAPGGEDPFSAESGVAIGQAAGWVVEVGGTTFYHLGDTCLFGDMKLIAERTPVDVALVPIGGHYTMDRHDAVVAVDLIAPKIVIPMHYNTFPPIEADAEAFKSDVETKTSAHCVVLDPGESHSKDAH
jgi:L-ascorbate metabolism protein UlaG (beta-lactamase superfamily)